MKGLIRGNNNEYDNKNKDVFAWCFAFWPLFWILWACFRTTVSIHSDFNKYILFFLCALLLLSVRHIAITPISISWLVFVLAIIPSGFRGVSKVVQSDYAVIICGLLFCFLLQYEKFNRTIILRCLYHCGLFIAVTILIDAVTGLFHKTLFSIYTASVQDIIKRQGGRASGGIIPYTGHSGGFLCIGLGAFLSLQNKNKTALYKWTIIAVFLAAYTLTQKRGFIIHVAVSVFIIWLMGVKTESLHIIELGKTAKTLFAILISAAICLALYTTVPLISNAVDSLSGRFTEEDTTLSGRTVLYEFAIQLFKKSPVLGIGWGQFRAQSLGVISERTFQTHNVYLQLLCETGIVGLTAFVSAAAVSLYFSLKRYRSLIEQKDEHFYSVRFGVYVQLFFLAYCMSGNPLYDYNFLIIYFIGILISLEGAEKNTIDENMKYIRTQSKVDRKCRFIL